MKSSRLLRLAVVVGAALMAPLAAALPAAAAPKPSPGAAFLDIPDAEYLTAATFAAKGCQRIPGGAHEGFDGWEFDQPVQGAVVVRYAFGFGDRTGNEYGTVVLIIDADGVHSIEPPSGDPEPAPAGVTGGLIEGGGAWLRTPAGWRLGFGALLHDLSDDQPAAGTFSLVRTCPPPAVPVPVSPAPGPPAGAGGPVLPVTGTNVAVVAGGGALLLAAGMVLLRVRRRRVRVTFIA